MSIIDKPIAQTEQPILWKLIDNNTPRDNKRMLYLAEFSEGKLKSIDFDGIWEQETGTWEMPEDYWYWASANGIEEPTHWAFQDETIPVVSKDQPPRRLHQASRQSFDVVTDEEIKIAFLGTNFGTDKLRELLEASVLKKLVQYHCGHTITTIMTRMGLIDKKEVVTKKGISLIREAYSHLMSHSG